jgi:hypothetical protein
LPTYSDSGSVAASEVDLTAEVRALTEFNKKLQDKFDVMKEETRMKELELNKQIAELRDDLKRDRADTVRIVDISDQPRDLKG